MIISERLVQSEKALLPILITLFGIVMLFKLVHLQKVPTSIRFTLFGITISVRLVQSENAYLEILFVSCLNSRSEERRVGKECRSRWSPYH